MRSKSWVEGAVRRCGSGSATARRGCGSGDGGKNLIGLSTAARAGLGVEIGDTVDALVDLDDAPREVEVPQDLAAALDAAAARALFDALAPSRRKERVRGLLEAKAPETRARRVQAVVTSLA